MDALVLLEMPTDTELVSYKAHALTNEHWAFFQQYLSYLNT